jgi:hypothetical protein
MTELMTGSDAAELAVQNVEGPAGAISMVAAGVLAILSLCLWLPVVAFLNRWWWGAIAAFIPGGILAFVYYHWSDAKRPLLAGVGFAMLAVCIFAVRALLVFYSRPPI